MMEAKAQTKPDGYTIPEELAVAHIMITMKWDYQQYMNCPIHILNEIRHKLNIDNLASKAANRKASS